MSLVGELVTAVPKGLMRKVVGSADDGARYAHLLADLGQIGEGARPVVIQGGYSTSGYMYQSLQELLRSVGFADVTATPLPLHGFASFQADARALRKVVEAASTRSLAAGGDGLVTVVAHSKGGLTSRWMLQHLEGVEYVGQLITLGSPHNGVAPLGTTAARLSTIGPEFTGGRQLIAGSGIIHDLNRGFGAFMGEALTRNPDFRIVSIAGDVGGVMHGTDKLISNVGARLDPTIEGVANLVFQGEGANHLAIAAQTGAFEPTLRATALLAAGRPIADAAQGARIVSGSLV